MEYRYSEGTGLKYYRRTETSSSKARKKELKVGLNEDKIMGRVVCRENKHLVARIFLQKEEAGSLPEIRKWNG